MNAQSRGNLPKSLPAVTLLAAANASMLLTGCGMTSLSGSGSSPVTATSVAASGRVMGGQQPVAGVAIQLYFAGSGSYGAAATAVPTGAITTTALGNFTIPTYTCPTAAPATNVFLVGVGGTPIGGSKNSNLAMMVGLGPCNQINQSAFINVNEITTVATVYALSGFMNGPTNIGAPTTNMAGLTRAFAAINKLVNTTNGATSGPALPTGATLPVTEINALGNILQNCINSAGSTGAATDGLTTGTPCDKLFYLATPQGGTAPADTITAALNIAQHPGLPAASTPSFVSKLNSLQSGSPAFSPSLSVNTPPNDWTIAINYTGGGLSTPKSLAIDGSGNVWVTIPSTNRVVKLDNTGAGTVVSGFTGSSPSGIAIDQSGNAWVTNNTGNSIAKIDPTGATSTPYTGNGLTSPAGIAIDGAGDVWIANSGANTISAFTNTGAVLGTSPFSGSGITAPGSIAINPK